jgi:ribose 5-phosphate isomerase
MVEVHETECCGLGQLRGIGTGTTTREIAEAIKDGQNHDKGYLIATLTKNEVTNGAGDLLTNSKFRALAVFRNPESGNLVTLYGINIGAGKWVPEG